MAAVIDAFKKYYLHSESYKALNENENQGSILMRTCGLTNRRKQLN